MAEKEHSLKRKAISISNDNDNDDEDHTKIYANTTVEKNPSANITHLGEDLQDMISHYMTIHEWGLLKRASKVFQTWPQPPSPTVEYHLIQFQISDAGYEAYFGYAKTLQGVIDAFQYMNNEQGDGESLEYLSYRFIHIGTLGEKWQIPLLQYSMAETMESVDSLSRIHPIGSSHFQVKDAGHLPTQPAVRRMMSRSCINIWPDPGGRANNTSAYNGVLFDDVKDIAPFIWFKNAKPIAEVDLRHLCHKRGLNFFAEEAHELWIDTRAKPNSEHFHFGADVVRIGLLASAGRVLQVIRRGRSILQDPALSCAAHHTNHHTDSMLRRNL